MTSRGTVHVVDDDEAVRDSLSFMLGLEEFDVRTWPSAPAFLAGHLETSDACILLDVRMPEMDGLQALEEIRTRWPYLPVIMLTGHGDVRVAVQALKRGASDFIEKPFERTVLLQALSLVRAQRDEPDDGEGRNLAAQRRLSILTPRELEVLDGLVQGLPNKTIAYDLGISPRTVEVHRANLMTKLQVETLSDVLRLAFQAGIGL